MKIIFIIFALFVADYTSSAQDCEKAFFSQLEQTYHRKKNKFVRIIKKAAPCRNCGNAPDLKILTDKDVILVSKVFFTKQTIKLIRQGGIDKSKFLCYMNPKSMNFDFAIFTHENDSFYVIEDYLGEGYQCFISDTRQNIFQSLANAVKKYQPDIVFTTGCAIWDGYVLFCKEGKVQTLNLETGIMEPITENSTYVKDNLNTSLGIMTKPDKRVICY